jgi:hypothetical protein
MIRTIPIPKTVGRMGSCGSGGDCCDDCRRTGPPIGPAATHVHSMLGRLGDVASDIAAGNVGPGLSCDDSGNCTYNGVAITSSATTTPAISSTWLYIGGAFLIVALLEMTGRKGR